MSSWIASMSSVSFFAGRLVVRAIVAPVKVPAYTAWARLPVPAVSRLIESVGNAAPPGGPATFPLTAGLPFGVRVTARPSDEPASEWRWVTRTVADLRIEPAGTADGGA